MIASLRGTLLQKSADAVVIEAAGVGYAVTVTAAALRTLPEPGQTVFLLIYTHFSQDNPLHLFGFAEAGERRLFETLLTVQGVGPKVAVAILSQLATGDLVRAIATEDLATLTSIKGIGKKTAERLCVELRDKIGEVAGTGTMEGIEKASVAFTGSLGDVHGALLALGYKPAEFETILRKLDAATPVADLIKQALHALRRK